jgi:DNA ligase-1
METEEQVLYMKDNTGAIREWGISYDGEDIIIRHGQLNGSMQYQREFVPEGKASRSLEEQIDSRMNSRINKQLDKGYVYDLTVAKTRDRPVNAMGLPKPMLAQKLRDVKNINYEGAITQPKFDGNRCLIYCEDGVNKAYSRNGKAITAIKHILSDIQLEDGMILDGELYCHGYPLQTIVSWIKREQEETAKINYHLYDIVSPHLPYTARSDIIRTLPIGQSIKPVYGDSIDSHESLLDRFRAYREQGYEGAILRWGNTGYEDGKRSKSLVKVKSWESEEFPVLDVYSSSDGWGILECSTPSGDLFRVSAPGDMNQKKYALLFKEHFIGRMVTIEYAQLTKDGIPFHPIAINFRDEIQ